MGKLLCFNEAIVLRIISGLSLSKGIGRKLSSGAIEKKSASDHSLRSKSNMNYRSE